MCFMFVVKLLLQNIRRFFVQKKNPEYTTGYTVEFTL